jgi:hypothetical protein
MKEFDFSNESWDVLAELGAFALVYLGFVGVLMAAIWKIYVKAGMKGWSSLIPVYNVLVMLKITGKPAWWTILIFIPFVNLIPIIIVLHNLSLCFGKGVGTTLLMLVAGIGFIALGFGDARYAGPYRQGA